MASFALAPLPQGELLGTVPFAGEGDLPLDTLVGTGLGGRRSLDLSKLTQASLVTPTEQFFIRTRCPEPLPLEFDWTMSVGGLVQSPVHLRLMDLLPEEKPQGVHLIECAGNNKNGRFGLMSGVCVMKVGGFEEVGFGALF